MSTVLGCDFRSGAIDLVYLDEDDQFARWHHLPTRPGIHGAREIPGILPTRRELEEHGVYLISLEQPMGQHRSATVALFRIQGAILATLPPDIPVWTFQPNEWRKAIGLPGNCPKTTVQAWSLRHGGHRDWTQDAHDALALATAAREINAEAIQLALKSVA